MADETTTTTEPVAEAAPAEHTAAPVDPNAIQHVLDVLAEEPEPKADEQAPEGDPKSDEIYEPMGSIGNCP
ncbi:hypothetical protein [Kitasatospora sp. NPDC085879]|uniref:hypothetical protein n=1 Tax=Kitasatospora sp. NPDC085879 TaxID=3154769 RepID=UPI000BB0E767|nr:hypothetical protein [Streptomyces sp. TLI_235]PBC78033.1 hypothetical protein BX265_2792 [Streptomyces sp. TLI_235]